MVTITYATSEISSRIDEIATVYRRAFNAAPWFLNWSHEHVISLIEEARQHEKFETFLGLGVNGEVIAAYWYYPLTVSEIEQELAPELATFAQEQIITHALPIIVYEKALFVDPFYHRRGIAGQLRDVGLTRAVELYGQQRMLILTRHREDHTGIIHLSEHMGFSFNGVKMSFLNDEIFRLFYAKIVQSMTGVFNTG